MKKTIDHKSHEKRKGKQIVGCEKDEQLDASTWGRRVLVYSRSYAPRNKERKRSKRHVQGEEKLLREDVDLSSSNTKSSKCEKHPCEGSLPQRGGGGKGVQRKKVHNYSLRREVRT